MDMQKVYSGKSLTAALEEILKKTGIGKLFVVCGGSCSKLPEVGRIRELPAEMVWFSGFSANPTYESVCEGVRLFRQTGCQGVLAVGGGSAIDVAKCVKLYSSMDPGEEYLEQEPRDNGTTLIAVPATAGTGSEATPFAVIYHKGEKQSVSHPSLVPSYVVLEPRLLRTLPMYQRKATMLDALCHGLEAWWSVNSTKESRGYSREAVEAVLRHMDGYLRNMDEGNQKMLEAANLAGKAIHIAQTTAAHAMCYKITSLCGLAHGHAAALCLPKLWRYTLEHPERWIDARGPRYLRGILEKMAQAMGCGCAEEAPDAVERILADLGMEVPSVDAGSIPMLAASVNPARLKNHPVLLDEKVFGLLYRQILIIA